MVYNTVSMVCKSSRFGSVTKVSIFSLIDDMNADFSPAMLHFDCFQIYCFRVRPDTNARLLAEKDDVEVHLYDVIYEAVDDVTKAMEGMLSPEVREKILGAAEVREIFKISKVGTIAGCYVSEGVINRKGKVRLIRDGSVAYTGDIASLKRFKDDMREVREGFECGIAIANFNDVKVGDLIECYVVEEFARTLAGSSAAKA
mgnify:CR=1 FL=1